MRVFAALTALSILVAASTIASATPKDVTYDCIELGFTRAQVNHLIEQFGAKASLPHSDPTWKEALSLTRMTVSTLEEVRDVLNIRSHGCDTSDVSFGTRLYDNHIRPSANPSSERARSSFDFR